MKAVKVIVLVLSLSLMFPLAVMADDTLDAIEQGLAFYKKGKFSKAIGELEFALAQLRQKKGEAIEAILPDAPEGWVINKNNSGSSGGGGMFGGGVSVSRAYRQQSGRGQATIEIMSDSPLMQGMAAMLQNPMFAQGQKGTKLIRFQGEKALLTSQRDDRAELQMLINNKMLFKVSVRKVKDAAEVAKQFGKLVDLDKLAAFAK